MLRKLPLDALRIGVRHVHLVDRDNDGNSGGLGVVDRLPGLRHDAVIGRHDKDGNVRRLRASGPHCGERLVTRRVQERDGVVVVLDLVGADVLRDPADLLTNDVGLTNGVEKGGLPVVHVTQDGGYRGPGLVVLAGLFGPRVARGPVDVGLSGVPATDAIAHRSSRRRRRLKVDDVVDSGHDANAHELLDDFDRIGLHRLRQGPHHDRGRQFQHLVCRTLSHRRGRTRGPTLASTPARSVSARSSSHVSPLLC